MNNINKHLFFSQHNQDYWVNKNIFKNKLKGVFVDIGAYDGKTFNNTYFFEKRLQWHGICVEPMPDIFQLLKKNRDCVCVEGGVDVQERTQDFMRIYGQSEMLSGFVDKYEPKHIERIQNELTVKGGMYVILKIKTYKINDLLAQNNFSSIDFLSLDTEGGELDILKSIDFDRYHIQVITVENNYGDNNFLVFLKSKGYQKVICLGSDEIFVKL